MTQRSLLEQAKIVLRSNSVMTQHAFLCHAGETCVEDGCTAAADPLRLTALNTASLWLHPRQSESESEELQLLQAATAVIQRSLETQFRAKIHHVVTTGLGLELHTEAMSPPLERLIKDFARNAAQGLSELLLRR